MTQRWLSSAVGFGLLIATVSAAAETTMYLEKCQDTGKTLLVSFSDVRGSKRVMTLYETKLTIKGDSKGEADFADVRQLELSPKLKIYFRMGGALEYGPLTAHCRKKIVEFTSKRKLKVSGADG